MRIWLGRLRNLLFRTGAASGCRLIVNADDYGLSPGVSLGIREAHRNGIVTTTTAMMNSLGVTDEIRRAANECPGLGIGVHLVLTTGRPLLSVPQVPTLVAADGWFPRLSAWPELFQSLDVDQLQGEWRRQVESFLSIRQALDHIDSHHHIAYRHSKLFAVLVDLAREYNVPLRNPLPLPGRIFEPDIIRTLAESRKWNGVRRPLGLVATFGGDAATVESLVTLIKHLPNGTVELMCHPGRVDADLAVLSSYNAPRQQELAVLCDPRVREAITRRGVVLSTFAACDSGSKD